MPWCYALELHDWDQHGVHVQCLADEIRHTKSTNMLEWDGLGHGVYVQTLADVKSKLELDRLEVKINVDSTI